MTSKVHVTPQITEFKKGEQFEFNGDEKRGKSEFMYLNQEFVLTEYHFYAETNQIEFKNKLDPFLHNFA